MRVVVDRLPFGREIWKYLETRGDTRLPMNVSKEADAAFMSELKRSDRKRYDQLVVNMQEHAYATLRKQSGESSASQEAA